MRIFSLPIFLNAGVEREYSDSITGRRVIGTFWQRLRGEEIPWKGRKGAPDSSGTSSSLQRVSTRVDDDDARDR